MLNLESQISNFVPSIELTTMFRHCRITTSEQKTDDEVEGGKDAAVLTCSRESFETVFSRHR